MSSIDSRTTPSPRDAAQEPPAERMSAYLPFGKPDFSDREIEAVARVLRSGWVGMGPETLAFERELAVALGVPHVVTTSSCTSAMLIALKALGIGPGDEVICPSLTWCSTANAALYLGATPVFCDVDPRTLCIGPDEVLRALTPRTRAVMVVHFGGLAAPVEALRRVLPPTVAILEDAAHAFGSRHPDGRPVGASGNAVCFSFYANKTLSTGEGGAVAVFDEAIADQVRSLRQHGLPVDAWKRFTHPEIVMNANLTQLGFKANYTDLQAAIGRVQLARQEEFGRTRLAAAQAYAAGLAGLPLRLQQGVTDPAHSRHLFIVVLEDRARVSRDALLAELRRRNIGATIHYEPLHLMPLYLRGEAPARLPQTERIAANILTLPIGASVRVDQANAVVAAIREILA
jgi:dTDP-4-amino-4,6-dideoxygalactose transaminase